MKATTSSKSAAASSQVTRTNMSSALASTLVQSDKSTASLSAVNADKFASTLRESSSAAASIGQQKEISVIDHHRKQSLQKQSRNEWSGGGGYELNAHTGRTAAYGGRDYEYSSSLVGGGSRRSEARTSVVEHSYSSSQSAARQQQNYSSTSSAAAAAFRHENASSSYQSTAQQSYKGIQVRLSHNCYLLNDAYEMQKYIVPFNY